MILDTDCFYSVLSNSGYGVGYFRELLASKGLSGKVLVDSTYDRYVELRSINVFNAKDPGANGFFRFLGDGRIFFGMKEELDANIESGPLNVLSALLMFNTTDDDYSPLDILTAQKAGKCLVRQNQMITVDGIVNKFFIYCVLAAKSAEEMLAWAISEDGSVNEKAADGKINFTELKAIVKRFEYDALDDYPKSIEDAKRRIALAYEMLGRIGETYTGQQAARVKGRCSVTDADLDRNSANMVCTTQPYAIDVRYEFKDVLNKNRSQVAK